jgi:hypothetical protein
MPTIESIHPKDVEPERPFPGVRITRSTVSNGLRLVRFLSGGVNWKILLFIVREFASNA